MLIYDKRMEKITNLMIGMGLAFLIIVGFSCIDGEPSWDVFFAVVGFMSIWFGVLALIFLIPMIRMNKRCKKVDEFGYELYGVIVGARRSSDYGNRGFTWIYGFDIAVFDGKNIQILTLRFQKWLAGFDVKKCYSYVSELTKEKDEVITDFDSVFCNDSPLFIKGKIYNSDVLFKNSVTFKEVPSKFVDALHEYCIKKYNCKKN